jgi:hypothetical protein
VGYQILADIVVLAHFGFILFVLLGGLLAFRCRWIPWLHIPAVAWGGFIEFTGWICPLTPLENSLRRAGGLNDYSHSFIEHYVVPVVYPAELSREIQIGMGFILIGLNVVIYVFLAWRRSKRFVK